MLPQDLLLIEDQGEVALASRCFHLDLLGEGLAVGRELPRLILFDFHGASGRLHVLDLVNNQMDAVPVRLDDDCPAGGLFEPDREGRPLGQLFTRR